MAAEAKIRQSIFMPHAHDFIVLNAARQMSSSALRQLPLLKQTALSSTVKIA